ncbi:RVP_2 domain-containing protein [Cephalotus follicularis]|uniref:RVP_2 domain-containing protein n=1 Tax=Cephalotus follicularis TaxID=3775 RepID=A0A1Q3CE26_CEPFO|nr:RVP_2 domain-containing protein [Cephalotus follicularis]
MRVHGTIGHCQVILLIDSSSTHNFFNNKVVENSGLSPNSEGSFEVAIANGEKLSSSGLYDGVCIMLQGVPMVVDFYLLPLGGYDAVLGAQWLRTLGPILWEFSKLQMSFSTCGSNVVLQGMHRPENRL